MSDIIVSESRIIPASADALFAIVADYRDGHQAILPRAYFDEMIVEKGGVGEGTELFLKMTVLGVTRTFRQTVTVPEPGRKIVEAHHEQGVETSFAFDPINDGGETRVTITTRMPASAGFAGVMERLMNPPIMKRIYREELRNLESYALRQLAAALA